MRYDLEECKYELLFLARFSISSLEYFRSRLDLHKLAYLRHILTEPSNEEISNAIEVMEWLKGVHTGGISEYEMLNERINSDEGTD